MIIELNWDFETAVREISNIYYPGGIATGQVRNRLIEAWGQLVGRKRAIEEFDAAIKKYGSLTTFGMQYRVTVRILQRFRDYFEALPEDTNIISGTKTQDGIVKVFISYSWDDQNHINWVKEFSACLRSHGFDVTLDQWHLIPGDQLTEFMEKSVRESDYVLVVCTQKYKERSNKREGGVGYEGDIITSEILTNKNHRKFIPILRQPPWDNSAPTWMKGKYYIDLSSPSIYQENFDRLISTLNGASTMAPPIGKTK